ncbi:glutathione S-transferase [Coprinopsis cinerea okayama7|uniref:glutathione transferase n=1 Tax=Coprinopsis cinerea (strain Okayama-7 / 130 / ATCC MYA-4618 / FGSC 9003) TaxID=240176 RepID=A8P3N6_COPC7|nr:glutathione S-transferase [Coprinopsis cinerea okayama7\|eukprot:XP_001838582.1 glutathione S-transferase [Coprinopsis cinerea okayama7\
MVLKLFGHPDSTCTKRAAVVLHEKNIPFEFHQIDFSKQEHKSPGFLEKQPFGQVPYLDDDGFIVYESRAIARYLAEKYADKGPALIPVDIKKKGLFEQAASVEVSNFDAFAAPAVWEKVFKPFYGLTTDEEALKKHLTSLEAKLDVYDKILGKQKYLAGDEVTLADLFHLSYGALLPAVGSNAIQDRPNVARWFNDISERPAWKAIKDGIKPISA